MTFRAPAGVLMETHNRKDSCYGKNTFNRKPEEKCANIFVYSIYWEVGMFQPQIGLRDLMDQMSGSTKKRWGVLEWFRWPYDIFALTSKILKMTGAYRYIVIKPFCENWDLENWNDAELAVIGKAWKSWVFQNKDRPSEKKLKDTIATFSKLYQENYPIRLIGDRYDNQENISRKRCDCVREKCACQLWPTILRLHAYADCTCAGAGLSTHTYEDKTSLLNFTANMLLARRGTLSRIPKASGIVLPKMRTTQVGLTYRSLSHNLTFHQTEVDVFWRSIPWINREHGAINIIMIPWPPEIKSKYFLPAESIKYTPSALEISKPIGCGLVCA